MYAAPPMLNLVVLRSPDVHRAVRFYRVLGLLFTVERHGSGPEHYAAVVNGFVFEIYPLREGNRRRRACGWGSASIRSMIWFRSSRRKAPRS